MRLLLPYCPPLQKHIVLLTPTDSNGRRRFAQTAEICDRG